MRSFTLVIAVLAVVALFSLSYSAQAAPISINNHTFDTAGVADGGYSGTYPGWTAVNPGGYDPGYGGAIWGEYNPNNNGVYETCSPDAPPDTPGLDGYTCFFAPGTIVASGSGIEQTLSASFALNTDYTLTAAFGHRAPGSGMSTVDMQLLAGSTIIGSLAVDPNAGTLGWFNDFTLSVPAASVCDPGMLVGEALHIRFTKTGPSLECDFDNVRLDGTASPAPVLGSLTINNHTFDAAGVADGSFSGTYAGWTAVNPGGYDPGYGGAIWGEYNPNRNDIYETCTPDAAPDTPGLDGYTCFFAPGTIVASGSGIEQALSTPFALNTDYTLTAAFGHRAISEMSTVDMQLLAGSTVIGTLAVDPNTGTVGWFNDFTLSVPAISVPDPCTVGGRALGIRFTKTGPSLECDFDNVRLVAAAAPASGTVILIK